jgi:hypothetical protein
MNMIPKPYANVVLGFFPRGKSFPGILTAGMLWIKKGAPSAPKPAFPHEHSLFGTEFVWVVST